MIRTHNTPLPLNLANKLQVRNKQATSNHARKHSCTFCSQQMDMEKKVTRSRVHLFSKSNCWEQSVTLSVENPRIGQLNKSFVAPKL